MSAIESVLFSVYFSQSISLSKIYQKPFMEMSISATRLLTELPDFKPSSGQHHVDQFLRLTVFFKDKKLL